VEGEEENEGVVVGAMSVDVRELVVVYKKRKLLFGSHTFRGGL
jgi:hypothetical protein